MAANTPKRTEILEYLRTMYAAMRRVDDYWYDYADDRVTRRLETLDSVDSTDAPMLAIQSAEETQDVDRKRSDKEGRFFQVFILGFLKSDTIYDVDDDLEKFLYDVRRATMSDRGLGSNVLDTDIVTIRSDIGIEDEPLWGVFLMELSIAYEMFNASP